ncbi:hypothetical protein [Altererythrobacter sp.]|uniref:hypothetical protein n=1 Tax=Altererythrobacter sp. TaxID=1872480 RepID=UPI003D0905B7
MPVRLGLVGAVLACLSATPVLAAPGLGNEVYGPTVEKGETEIETRWDRLVGGVDDGEDVLQLEVKHGVTDRLMLALNAEFEKEPGESREFEALGIEAVYELGNLGGVDFGLYGEYEIVFEGADKIETKLLAGQRRGPWEWRLNLIAEKELEGGEPVEFEYAASADVEALGEIRIGAQAFGELGTTRDFLPHAGHFLGPVARAEIEGLGPEIELELGYLFALGAAKDDTDGQLRLGLEIEF